MAAPFVDALSAARVANQGGACTTAAVLTALGALGAGELPDLERATILLGASRPFGAPGLLDYVSWPGRRAPLDLRIEALAEAHRLRVRAWSGITVPGARLSPPREGALIVHLAWGQEAPGRYGTWGWHPLRPATYSTGGHSVVLAETGPEGWVVLDPNYAEPQTWPRPGLATARTVILATPASRPG